MGLHPAHRLTPVVARLLPEGQGRIRLADGGAKAQLDVLIEALDQQLLAGKVVKQGAVGHSGRPGDAGGGGPLQAILGAQGKGGIQDLAAFVCHGFAHAAS
ncbi:hypothetical protein D3C79_541600 [compost metagenome]